MVGLLVFHLVIARRFIGRASSQVIRRYLVRVVDAELCLIEPILQSARIRCDVKEDNHAHSDALGFLYLNHLVSKRCRRQSRVKITAFAQTISLVIQC